MKASIVTTLLLIWLQKSKIVFLSDILGPLLFLCYLGRLPGTVSNGSFFYFMQMTLSYKRKILWQNWDLFKPWFIEHKPLFKWKQPVAILYYNKSNFISFSTIQNKTNFSLKIHILVRNSHKIKESKQLVLNIDESLSWDKHGDNVRE